MTDNKTPEYTRRAVDNYLKKFDRIAVNLPKGTKERIKKTGQSANAFAASAILAELDRIEQRTAADPITGIDPEAGF